MKKIILILMPLTLAACSSHQVGQPQAPLDMQAVKEYQAKVYSAHRVSTAQSSQKNDPIELPLNASDHQPKTSPRASTPIILMPSVGYHRHHW